MIFIIYHVLEKNLCKELFRLVEQFQTSHMCFANYGQWKSGDNRINLRLTVCFPS